MSGDVAALGLAVDSSQVERGTTALTGLSNAAAKAETAATSFSAGATNAAAAATSVSTSASNSARALNAEASAATNAARALTQASSAAQRLAANQNAIKGQTGNIAAQFQDIAVSLQGGQSWMNVALQQGTQLSAVLGTVGGGARGVGAALGAAFTSVISPVSLITIGLIAAAGAAYQYFTAVDDGGAESEATLKKQEDLIGRVADKWGEAYPAIKAYNDEIVRTREQAELAAAIDIVKQDKLSNAAATVEDLRIKMADFVSLLAASGEDDTVVGNFQRNINDAIVAITKGEDASGSLNNAIKILSTDIVNTANPAVAEMVKELLLLEDQANKTAAQIATVVNSAAKVQEQLQNLIQASSFIENGQTRNPSEFMPKGNVPTPGSRPLIELEGTGDTKNAAGSTAHGIDEVAKAYHKLVQAQDESMSRLQLEANLIGASAQERALAIAKLEMEQKIRQSNVQLSKEQTDALQREAAAQANLKLKVDQMTEGWKTVQNAGMSAIDQLTASIGDMDASAKDIAQNLANTLLAPLKELAIANPLKNAIYGTNLPTMQSIGGFGGFFGALSGQKAPPLAGMPTATASMTVTAGTVMVNGGVSGLPGFPTSGVPGSTTTLSSLLGYAPANTNVASANDNSPFASILAGAGKTKTGLPLSTVNGPNGTHADVNSQYAGNFQGLINELKSNGYEINSLGGYNYRNIAGTNELSNHAFGNAIDINPLDNPRTKFGDPMVSNLDPTMARSLADKYGMKWGGDWKSADPMHFEVAKGAQPMQMDPNALENVNQSLSTLSNSTTSAATNLTSLNDSSKSLSSGFTNLFSSLGTGTSSTGGGGFFSFLGSLFSPASASPAASIKASAARPVIPAAPMQSAGGMQKVKVEVATSVDKGGNLKSYVKGVSQETVDERVPSHIRAYDEEHLPKRVQQISGDRYARG